MKFSAKAFAAASFALMPIAANANDAQKHVYMYAVCQTNGMQGDTAYQVVVPMRIELDAADIKKHKISKSQQSAWIHTARVKTMKALEAAVVTVGMDDHAGMPMINAIEEQLSGYIEGFKAGTGVGLTIMPVQGPLPHQGCGLPADYNLAKFVSEKQAYFSEQETLKAKRDARPNLEKILEAQKPHGLDI